VPVSGHDFHTKFIFSIKGTFHMALDILPSTTLGSGTQPNGIHFHSPGSSASAFNANSDFPAPPKSGTQVIAKIAPANGGPRFANPS
jgi:hypothetical protein